MKFQPDIPEGMNIIHASSRTDVSVNGQVYTTSMVVPGDAPLEPWPAGSVADLTEAHFEQLVRFKPELVIFGSGPTLRFVHPSLQRPLIEAGIGIETMDTPAACRTYNILMAEGRRVLAALLIHP
ncbi:MAG: hypothetical protein EOP40_09995 [Rubrivivax sp.]|nr:MAG: hypothetical protein EOP40_09995 [Rubrivivax sp.]